MTINIINIYVPQFTRGSTTVYAQIRNIMTEHSDVRDPLQAFYDYLKSNAKALLRASPFLILGGDFNEHIETSELMREKMETLMLTIYKRPFSLRQFMA